MDGSQGGSCSLAPPLLWVEQSSSKLYTGLERLAYNPRQIWSFLYPLVHHTDQKLHHFPSLHHPFWQSIKVCKLTVTLKHLSTQCSPQHLATFQIYLTVTLMRRDTFQYKIQIPHVSFACALQQHKSFLLNKTTQFDKILHAEASRSYFNYPASLFRC